MCCQLSVAGRTGQGGFGGGDVSDSPTTIEISVDIPNGATLTGVSVAPSEASPRIMVSVYLESKETLPKKLHLGSGVARAVDISLASGDMNIFPFTWYGELTTELSFSYTVKAVIRNLSGAAVRWEMQVFVK